MCEQCQNFERLANKARKENNPEKERVMRRLLEKHKHIQHGQPLTEASIEPNRIVWPNGVPWIVR